jgi:hypothetical protein
MSIFNLSSWKRCELTPRDRLNQQRLLIWFFVWMVSWVAANIAIKEGWASAGASAIAVAIFPTVLGVATMLAYWKFIREADELQRKIQLEGLAIGFGIGVVGALTIHVLERASFLTTLDLGDVAALMMFAYAIAVVVGERRYA